jgi:Family of unknown function (DUF5335)
MGVTKRIPIAEWETYFDVFVKRHLSNDTPKAATIEVLSPAIGDQFEARIARLVGLSYDAKSNAFEVLLEDLDHLVFHPADIWVIEEEGGFISALELIRADGAKEIIQLQRSGPPALRYELP